MTQFTIRLTALTFFLFCHHLFGQVPQTREQLAEQLYEVHGLGKMPFEAYRQWKITSGPFQTLAAQFPQITNEDWDTLFQRLYEVEQPALKKQFITFMLSRFDSAELAQIDSFYTSTAGKRLLASIPELFNQTAQARNDDTNQPVIRAWIAKMTKKHNLK